MKHKFIKLILITGWFDVIDRGGIPTGRKEFVVSHAVDPLTDCHVVVPSEHPSKLGGVYDHDMCEWVIYEDDK